MPERWKQRFGLVARAVGDDDAAWRPRRRRAARPRRRPRGWCWRRGWAAVPADVGLDHHDVPARHEPLHAAERVDGLAHQRRGVGVVAWRPRPARGGRRRGYAERVARARGDPGGGARVALVPAGPCRARRRPRGSRSRRRCAGGLLGAIIRGRHPEGIPRWRRALKADVRSRGRRPRGHQRTGEPDVKGRAAHSPVRKRAVSVVSTTHGRTDAAPEPAPGGSARGHNGASGRRSEAASPPSRASSPEAPRRYWSRPPPCSPEHSLQPPEIRRHRRVKLRPHLRPLRSSTLPVFLQRPAGSLARDTVLP